LKTVEPKAPQDTDKRNLYLAAEGVIREGDPAASFLTPAELALRTNAERIKAQKLRDPGHFVSRTRLCVRNLPLTCDERQLKNVFLRSCESNSDRKKKVGKRIVSVFVVRDKASGRTVGGVARSRGYGFVNFAEHEDALFTLRALNNAQTTFEDRVPGALKALGAASAGQGAVEEPQEDEESTARSTRRLVVEFAVENAKALNALEKRKQRAEAAHIQSRPEDRAGYGRGNDHSVTAEPDSVQPDQEKPKRTRKKRLSTKNRPNAAAKEAAAAAAAEEEEAVAATAPAANRAKHRAAAVAVDDQLASMDVEGERSADNPGKKRDRRGQKKQQRRDKEEEGALQDMIEQYKKKYY
jgi:nucleolar protein 4